MALENIAAERQHKLSVIQTEYDSLSNYSEKLEFVFNLLKTSQSYYLEWKGNNFLNRDYLNELQNQLSSTVKNDDDFVDFIDSNLTSKIESGHVFVRPRNFNIADAIAVTEREREIFEPFKNNNVEVSFLEDSVVIKVKSFANQRIAKDGYIFESLESYLKQNEVENVILDIRGNGGGSDEYFKNFSCFTDQTLPFKSECHDLFLDRNYSEIWEPIPASPDAKRYQKFLLVDNNVFSAAETLAKFCKQSGYATVVGEATLGEGGYGRTPFNIQLTSGEYHGEREHEIRQNGQIGENIGINFPTEAPINEKGEIQYEGFYNTIPDIECPKDQALDVVLSEIQNKRANDKLIQQNAIEQISENQFSELSGVNISKPFDQRSNAEVEIAHQIREKNTIIHRQQESGKVLTKSNSFSNSGFVMIFLVSMFSGMFIGIFISIKYILTLIVNLNN